MIAQYTAAGIVAENRRLAAPAVGRLAADLAACRRTTSRWAGRRPASCARVLDNLTSLLAVELLAAVRGLQLRAPLRRRRPAAVARGGAPPFAGEPGPDVFLAPVLEAARGVVAGPDLRAGVEASIGPLA